MSKFFINRPIVAMVIAILMVPITILLLGVMDGAKHESLAANLKSTVAKPLVWAPILGAFLKRLS